MTQPVLARTRSRVGALAGVVAAGALLLAACSGDSAEDSPPPPPPLMAEKSEQGALAFVEHFFDQVNAAAMGPDTELIPVLSSPTCDACAGLQGMVVALVAAAQRAAAPLFSVGDIGAVAQEGGTTYVIEFTLHSAAIEILNADDSVETVLQAGESGRVVAVRWEDGAWQLLGAESTD